MKKLFIFATLLIASGCSKAHYGQVRDADTGKPIVGARVELYTVIQSNLVKNREVLRENPSLKT